MKGTFLSFEGDDDPIWTDGKNDEGPPFPFVTRCAHCNNVIWLRDCEILGEIDDLAFESVCSTETQRFPQAWKDAPLIRRPTTVDVEEALATTNEPQRVRQLLLTLWRQYNDPYRADSEKPFKPSNTHLQLLRRLTLELAAEDENERLLIAEAYRELSDFDAAIKYASDQPNETQWVAMQIAALASAGVSKVAKLRSRAKFAIELEFKKLELAGEADVSLRSEWIWRFRKLLNWSHLVGGAVETSNPFTRSRIKNITVRPWPEGPLVELVGGLNGNYSIVSFETNYIATVIPTPSSEDNFRQFAIALHEVLKDNEPLDAMSGFCDSRVYPDLDDDEEEHHQHARPDKPPVAIPVPTGTGIAHLFETTYSRSEALELSRERSKDYGVKIYVRDCSLYVVEPKNNKEAFEEFWNIFAPDDELIAKEETREFFRQVEYDEKAKEKEYNPLWKPPQDIDDDDF